ncbi:CPBP family intramembrane glutamic endopeptidase [Spongiimicrobium salis]|uniref:CPBP family intramembrane glutamic endopeptidase n=1 Tax=Spongiimicrobium salis TaxID=1667022 RepID=UPI00374CC712
MKNSKPNTYPSIAQSFGITGIIILVMILLSLLTPTLKKGVGSEGAALLFQILAMGIPFLIVRGIQKRKVGKKPFSLTLKNKRIIPFLILAGVTLLLGIVGPITDFIPMPESMKLAYVKAASQTGVLTFVLMVVAAPILEEFIFRGIILDGLLKRYSAITAILLSSVLFAIVHLNPWQFVTGLIMGVFIGWVYYKSKSVFAAIIVHASANLSAYFLRFFVDSSTIDTSYVESVGGTTNFILVIASAILMISICVYFLKREFQKGLYHEK